MRRFLTFILLLAMLPAWAGYEFNTGTTSKIVTVRMYQTDGTPDTGLAFGDMTIAYARNEDASDQDVTEQTMSLGTWAEGGWIEVDATNSPGVYQFGLVDASLADGAESAEYTFAASGALTRGLTVQLIDVDLRGGTNIDADVIQWTGTNVATPATSGYVYATIKDGTGTGELDTDSGTVLLRSATETQIDDIETDTGTTLENRQVLILADTDDIGVAGAGLTDLGGMSTGMKAEVQVEADASLTSYNGPTSAEFDARTILSASYFDPALDAVATVTTNTDMRGTDSAATATGLATHDGKLDTVAANVVLILEDTGTTIPALIAALNDLSVNDILGGTVDGAVDVVTTLKRILSVIANDADQVGGVSSYRNSADDADVVTHTITDSGATRSAAF